MSYLGNVYISDTSNNRIRKVTVSTGIISTIAGMVGVGDNGPATSASLYQPFGVALDSAGTQFIFIRFIPHISCALFLSR